MNYFYLGKAVRAVYTMDSSPARFAIFQEYVGKRALARLILKCYPIIAGTSLSGLLFCIFGFLQLRKKLVSPTKKYNLLCTTDYVNERKAVSALLARVSEEFLPKSYFSFVFLRLYLLLGLLTRPAIFFRFSKFLRKFERRGTFLTSCRVAETLWCYYAIEKIFRLYASRGCIIASHYSPATCALQAVCAKYQQPTIYVNHSLINYHNKVPKLEVDLACLYGEHVFNAFKHHDAIDCKEVLFIGLLGQTSTLLPSNSACSLEKVGIFLTASTNEDNFKNLLETLNANSFIKQIIIRPHPLKSIRTNLAKFQNLKKVLIEESGIAEETAKLCDLIIAGNSSVYVEVLKCGKPSVYWNKLDFIGYDFYHLLKNQIVYELTDIKKIDIESIASFYNENWAKRFEKVDFLFRKKEEEINKTLLSSFNRLLYTQEPP
jgi:hypothetical protein